MSRASEKREVAGGKEIKVKGESEGKKEKEIGRDAEESSM